MRQMMAKIESGNGTLGKLVHDGRLYENLLESSHELEMALEQLRHWATDAREKGIRIKW
jgi:phospholipid/cholesterol/gamma-HCH transport system substrate-binding protein